MEPIVYECSCDLDFINQTIDQIYNVQLANQQLLSDIYHLGIWFVGALVGVFTLTLLYSVITKFAR